MPYQIVIKGTPDDARAALDAWGVHPSDRLTEPVRISGWDETTLTVKDEVEPGLIRWFTQTKAEESGALLAYAHFQGSNERHPISWRINDADRS